MAEIGSLGIFRGYADSGGDAEYGAFYVYFGYTVSGTTISNMKVYLRKTVQYKYTTNSAYIDSVAVNGQIFSVSPTSAALGSYNTANAGPTFTVSGSYYASSSSATVTIRMHRNAQSANAQTFTGTIYGLATAPTGVWCSLNSIGATEASLSGGYSSNGGASVTSTGYQYSTNNSSWSNCSSSPSGLSTGQKYYFRYCQGN